MIGVEPDINYYEILHVNIDSKEFEIRENYKKLILQFHPDLNKKSNATEEFKKILKAYSVLKDKKLRYEYDKELKVHDGFLLKLNFKYEYKKIKEKTGEIFKKIKIIFNNISLENSKKKNHEYVVDENIFIPQDILYLPVNELEQRLLYSDNHHVRFNAAIVLGYNKEKSSLNILESALFDDSLNVRKAIVWAIGNIGMKKSLHTLKKMYNSIESNIRLDIIKSVYKIAGENSSIFNNLLLLGLNDCSDEVKYGCLEMILKLNKKIKYSDIKGKFERMSDKFKVIIERLIVEDKILNYNNR